MTRSATIAAKLAGGTRQSKSHVKPPNKIEPRYSVALPSSVARQVKQYAEEVEVSMSKAITALVRQGLESQEDRKRQFFKTLKENLANDNPKEQDRLVDEFRALILGR
jgi:hypothetical protein